MIEKKVQIDGKEVTFATSARTPRLYRQYFRRDVMTDMASLYNKVQAMIKAKENAKQSQVGTKVNSSNTKKKIIQTQKAENKAEQIQVGEE